MTTFLGNPVTLIGKQLKIGETAPDFSLRASDLSIKSLSDFAGKKKVISVVPSIDTGICSTQTRTAMSDTVVITISADLPFAQARWCGVEGLEQAVMLSDYYDNEFGKTYGLLMAEWHLLARAVLVLDEDNKLVYAEYLENVNSEPNYKAAIEAVKAL